MKNKISKIIIINFFLFAFVPAPVFAFEMLPGRFFQKDSTWTTKIKDAKQCMTIQNDIYARTVFNCVPGTLDPDSTVKLLDMRCTKSSTVNYPNSPGYTYPPSGPECSGSGWISPVYTGDTSTLWWATGGELKTTIIPWSCARDSSSASCAPCVGDGIKGNGNDCPTSMQEYGWNINVPWVTGMIPGQNVKRLAAWPNSFRVGDGKMVIVSSDKNTAWDLDSALKFPDDFGPQKCTGLNVPYECCTGVGVGTSACRAELAGKIAANYLRKWDLREDGVTGTAYPYDMKGGGTWTHVGSIRQIVTKEEIDSGTINHAIAGSYAGGQYETHWTIYPSGANQGGNIRTTTSCIPYGQTGYTEYCHERSVSRTGTMPLKGGERMYLPANTNCEEIENKGGTRIMRLVCAAARDYGIIFTENAGNGYRTLFFENGEGHSWQSTYNAYFTGSNWSSGATSVGRIPWDNLKIHMPIMPNASVSDTTQPAAPTGLAVQ